MLLLHPPARTYSQKEKWWHKRSWQGQTCFPCNNWLYARYILCWNSPFVVNTHKHCDFNHRCKRRQNLGGCEGFLPDISKTCLKKTPKKWPPKKTSSCAFGCHFFQIKVYGVHFHPRTTAFYTSDINAMNKSKTHILPLFGFYTQHLKRWDMREMIVSWCWLRKRGFNHTKLQESFRKLTAVTWHLTKQDAIYRSRIEFLKQKVTFCAYV